MADHKRIIQAESAVDNATACAAVDVLMAAAIVAANPQPVEVIGYSNTGSIAVGPLKLFVVSCMISYQG